MVDASGVGREGEEEGGGEGEGGGGAAEEEGEGAGGGGGGTVAMLTAPTVWMAGVAAILARIAPSSIGLRRASSSSGVRIAFAIGCPPYRYLALRRRSSSWFVSLVLTMPESLPLDMTPMRLVMPRISGISEETTMIVLPSLAILMMSS